MKIFSPVLKGTTVSDGTSNLSGSFTGSLFGTATTASNANTASYVVSSQTDETQNTRLQTLESVTGSYASTSSFGAYTSSNDTTNTTQNARLLSNEQKTGSFATTGSNYFIGQQVITGSVYISSDLIVQGSSSLQNITASAVSIGTNTVILNTDSPAVRFAGISVRDSGSNSSVTSSIWYDSLNNKWIYQNESGSSYSGGMFISGPRNTGSLGSESGMDSGYITKGLGGDHIGPSIIFESGSNIGIGTTNPTVKLDIIGDVVRLTNTGSTSLSYYEASEDVATNKFIRVHYLNSAFPSSGTNVSSSGLIVAASGATGGLVLRTDTNAPIIFGTNGSSSERMRITGGGNIGINTPSPDKLLTLYSSAGSLDTGAVIRLIGNAAQDLVDISVADTKTRIYHQENSADADAGYGIIQFRTNAAPNPSFRTRGGFQFTVGSTDVISISNTFTVGMGITPDAAKLSIQGPANEWGLSVWSSTTTSQAYGAIIRGGTSSSDVAFRINNAVNDTTYFSIRGDGFVGIGTTNPIHALQINNGNLATYSNSYGNNGLIRMYGTDNNEKYQQGLTAGGDFYQYTFSGLNHIFYTSNTERMRITSGGNLELKNTNTNTQFVITNTSTASSTSKNTLIQFQGTDTTGTIKDSGAIQVTPGGVNYIDTSMLFYTRGGDSQNPRMTITGGGNVGIGSTAPTSRLTVIAASGAGALRVEGVTGQNAISLGGSGAFSIDYPGVGGGRFLVRDDGLVAFPRIQDFTTGNSPNTWINPASSFGIYINTSSIRYKRDIVDYDKGLDILNQIRPVYYKGISEVDGDKQFAGFIAEEIDELGLTEFVNYLEDGRPNSLSYPNMLTIAVKAIQELKAEVDTLRAQISQ
jgi:hypothetical protein